MTAEHFLPLRDNRALDLLKQAVTAAHIKAALDRSADQLELKLLLSYINRVHVEALADRPQHGDRPLVRMWHTQEELCDLVTSIERDQSRLMLPEEHPRGVRLELLKRRIEDVIKSGKAALSKTQMNGDRK